MTQRLDVALAARGLARSRAQAQTLVRAGEVLVDGEVVTRCAQPVEARHRLALASGAAGERRWVGRGALKLLAAIEGRPELARAVDGSRCLDVGASTGGFTQVLLEHGAEQVVALDVGHDQLAEELRHDARVVERAGVNARELAGAGIGRFDVVVCDVSFISLTLLLRPMREVCLPLAHLVVLVKPQFEVGRGRVGHGVVTDPAAWREAIGRVVAAAEDAGLVAVALERSPVEGHHGNREFLLGLRPASAVASGLGDAALRERIAAVTVTPTG